VSVAPLRSQPSRALDFKSHPTGIPTINNGIRIASPTSLAPFTFTTANHDKRRDEPELFLGRADGMRKNATHRQKPCTGIATADSRARTVSEELITNVF
jgi:hypothetical protein